MRRLSASAPRVPLLGPRDPAQPLVTLLSPAGRVELSGATCVNWAAKTANWLLSSGSTGPVGILLPLHWQVVTLLLGATAAGRPVVVGALTGCETAFTTTDRAPVALDAVAGDVVAVSTAPLGGRLREALPPLVLDAGEELPTQGDRFAVRPAAAWQVSGPGLVAPPVPDLGLGPADRVLTVLDPAAPGGLLALLAPLLAGSALVLAPDVPDPVAVAAEGITACAGLDVPGARRLL